MGQPAERLRDNDNKENNWKQETEDHRETADHLLPIDTRSTRQPSIGHGRTARQIHHYLYNRKVTDLQTQTGFRHKTKKKTSKGKGPTREVRDQRGDGQGRQHHGRPQQTSSQTTEDGTGTQEAQNQTVHHRIPHNNNRHGNYTQNRKQEHRRTRTRNKNTTTGKCTQKQDNRIGKEDIRSMGNERNATVRTPQTSINNQQKQSKARHELDRTINRYKELNKRTDSRPKQHKHYIKGKLITAIAIIIMIIATASLAANDIVTTTYETYNKEQQLSKEDTVNRIKAATTKEPQNTTQEAYATHAKLGTRTKKHDKTGNESDAKHNTGKEQRQICVMALLTENYRQAKGHCPKVQQTRKMATTRRAQGQGRTRGTKSRA
jgi:hypothetical protein